MIHYHEIGTYVLYIVVLIRLVIPSAHQKSNAVNKLPIGFKKIILLVK